MRCSTATARHTALAATVSFKTFVSKEFTRKIKDLTGLTLRKLGLKFVDGNQH